MDKSQQKKRTQLSFIIRDAIEKLNRSGVNCLKYDQKAGRLYAGGRDSIIRIYNDSYSQNSLNFDPYLTSLSHHTDWVNDMVLTNNGRTLFSASSDTTIKIWNTAKGTLLNTLKMHKDYVKCLAYAKDKDLIASAGFDKNIFLWDVQTACLHPNSSSFKMQTINDNKYSLYSLAINNQGTILASGSPENCIRIWDPRTCNKIMKLKGHTHNIRALILNKDGTQLLSASSDNTIKLWSIGQQRCISTLEIHTHGVWSLCVNDSFTKCISGGKDLKVFMTDLRNPDNCVLVCEETAPLLSIEFGNEQQSIWVSTTNTDIKNWSLKGANENYINDQSENSSINDIDSPNLERIDDFQTSSLLKPINEHPIQQVKGGTSIKQCTILNDKRYAITKDSADCVAVWDILKIKCIENLGQIDYEQKVKSMQKFIHVPNWLSIDLKLGLLTITLDENDCLSAWINYNKDESDLDNSFFASQYENKVNYGCLILEALFRNCPFVNLQPSGISPQPNSIDKEKPNEIKIPDHTPIIFSEVGGRILYRTEYRDIGRESEQQALTNVLPLWIIDPLINKNFPKFNKIVFMLNPHPPNSKLPINKDKLTAIDLLSVKKLKEHVYQKILKLNETQSQQPTNENTNDANQNNGNEYTNANGVSTSTSNLNCQDLCAIADRIIEVICNDQVLNDPDMDLRTIKHLISKGSGEFVLYYRLKNEK